jgi:uncharacterized protein DUF5991
MKQNLLVVFLFVTIISLTVDAQRMNRLPRTGTVTGVINRTESDINGLFSVWMKVGGKMYEFTLAKTRIIGGSKSDLQKKGISVRIIYRGLEHSEMDDFYSGEAMTITILNNSPTEPRGPSNTTPPSKDVWEGTYLFVESARRANGLAMRIEHTILIHRRNNRLVADLDADGYQTETSLKCDTKTEGNRIYLYLRGYGENV